jgi:hypothetical protein
VRTNLDPDFMGDLADRIERLRDYVPAEEFDANAAAALAHRELRPFVGDTATGTPPPNPE